MVMKPRGLGKRKVFQAFIMEKDRQTFKAAKDMAGASQDIDILEAQEKLIMGSKQDTSLSNASTTMMSGRSKEEIFDHFLSDMFTSKLNISNA